MLRCFQFWLGVLFLAHVVGAEEIAIKRAGPRVTIGGPPQDPSLYSQIRYPWKKQITATVFWIGEKPSKNNATPNNKSSWDQNWQNNYGGVDEPSLRKREGFRPKGFIPRQNPFYIALPYNDVTRGRSKPEAPRVIPWFKRAYKKQGRSVCKGRWVQIVYKGRSCFAQWEDCGPWVTDDWSYVFGNKRPKTKRNGGAGIDISPAIRDYLRVKSGDKVSWRFVEKGQVRQGPWTRYGTNNPFVNPKVDEELSARIRYHAYLRKKRDEALRKSRGSR